ncbi:hypothetical protein L484_010043 [Morus notabilis]|uniref:Uncharacterized protein n=1 Tax=Morus notabilis TaxID=981085 RepID=W9RKN7_9ROSA|nr:hypothetical protein L484_010043 [Morus notabilis]
MFVFLLKIAAPPAWRRRGQGKWEKTRGIDIQNVVSKEGKLTVQFDKDGKMWKALGGNGMIFETAIGIDVRDVLPPYLHTWASGGKRTMEKIGNKLKSWFNIPLDPEHTTVTEREAKKMLPRLENRFGRDRVEKFRQTHYREGHGWASDEAEAEFHEMERRYHLATQEGKDMDEGSSSAILTREKIVADVLGERRGYRKGIDPMLSRRNIIQIPQQPQANYEELGDWFQQIYNKLNQANINIPHPPSAF